MQRFKQSLPIVPSIAALAASLLLLPALMCGVSAREWSEDVRLTYTQGSGMAYPLLFAFDPNDDIHLIIDLESYRPPPRSEGIYQKFTRIGEALTDTFAISVISGMPDSSSRSLSMFLNPNDLLYILWSSGLDKFCTIIDIDGEVVDSATHLINVPSYNVTHKFNIAIDSDDRIIISGSSYQTWGDSIYTCHSFYQRYSMNGEQIGETHILDRSQGIKYKVDMQLTEGDTLMFVWRQNHNRMNSTHFSKVAPNDSFIIDDELIEPRDNWGGEVSHDVFTLGRYNQPVLLLVGGRNEDSIHVRKYDTNLNEIFQTCLGDPWDVEGDIFIDDNSDIHVVNGFETPEFDRYLGYSRLDEEGNILDSAEVIFGREDHPRGWWDRTHVFACADDFVGVIWIDSRFGSNYEEVFLKYKTQNSIPTMRESLPYSHNPIIYPNYPDPFNVSTYVSYFIPYNNSALFYIATINGKIIYEKSIYNHKYGTGSFVWNGKDLNGISLPSGSYFVVLKSGYGQAVEQVRLVK